MMHIAGVDVKPLDDLLGEQEALEAQGKQIPKQLDENLSSAAAARLESLKQAGARAKEAASTASKSIEEVQSQGREAATGINSSMEANIEKLGEKSPIISGCSDLLLKGKTTEEIRQDAMNHLFGNAKVAGITNPTGYIMLTFGLMKMAMGNPYGILNRSIRSFSRRCFRPSKESIFSRLDVLDLSMSAMDAPADGAAGCCGCACCDWSRVTAPASAPVFASALAFSYAFSVEARFSMLWRIFPIRLPFDGSTPDFRIKESRCRPHSQADPACRFILARDRHDEVIERAGLRTLDQARELPLFAIGAPME